MNARKAKNLRRTAAALSDQQLTTTYTEKTVVKKVVTNELNEQGQRIEKFVKRTSVRLNNNCARAVYQQLKKLS